MCYKLCKKCCCMLFWGLAVGAVIYLFCSKKEEIKNSCCQMKNQSKDIAEEVKFAAQYTADEVKEGVKNTGEAVKTAAENIRDDVTGMKDCAQSVFESGENA